MLAKSGSGDVAAPSYWNPLPESWEWLDALAGDVDEDFVSAVGEQTEATERPGLAS